MSDNNNKLVDHHEPESNIDDSLTDKGTRGVNDVSQHVDKGHLNGSDVDARNPGAGHLAGSGDKSGTKDDTAQRRPSIANLLSASNQVASEERFARGLDQVPNAGRPFPPYGYGFSGYPQQQPYGAYPPPPHGQGGPGKLGKDGEPTDQEVPGDKVDSDGANVPPTQGGQYGGFPPPVQYGGYYGYSNNNYYYQNGNYQQQQPQQGAQPQQGQQGNYNYAGGRPYYYPNQQYPGGTGDNNYQNFEGQGQTPHPPLLAPNEGSSDSGEPKTKKRKKSVSTPVSTAERPYHCSYDGCEWSFARLSDQRRHIRSHEKPTFHCPYWRSDPTCHRNGGAFNRLDVLKRHLRLVHFVQFKQSDSGWCRVCQKMFTSPKHFVEHCESCASAVRPAEWKVGTNENVIPQPSGKMGGGVTVTSEHIIGDADSTVRLLTDVDPNVDSQLKDPIPGALDASLAEKARVRARTGVTGRKKTLSQAIQAGHHASSS